MDTLLTDNKKVRAEANKIYLSILIVVIVIFLSVVFYSAQKN